MLHLVQRRVTEMHFTYISRKLVQAVLGSNISKDDRFLPHHLQIIYYPAI
jgi:hypothetical protein